MVSLPFMFGDWKRTLPEEAQLPLLNRYFETTPSPTDAPAALIARPNLKRWMQLGPGPIRCVYTQHGAFSDALFIVSGSSLYKIATDETATLIGTSLAGSPYGHVIMTATDTYLFIADGSGLYVYTDNAHATGTLTASGAIASGDQVRIGAVYYQFTSGDVNAGSPQGTSGNPWLIKLGASNSEALDNLAAAIEASGTAGTDYSLTLTASTEVQLNSVTATTLAVRALVPGTSGNSIATTETGANIAWGAATLASGGSTSFAPVATPDGVGVIWVETIASHVICVMAQATGKSGRFYWIEPGETTIDALNFATAERAPDPLYAAIALGDHLWLHGSTTTEIWYPTGDFAAPFLRSQGRLFDHGVWRGTPLRVKNEIIAVDRDGVAWRIGDGATRISNHGIEQRIREAMAEQLRNV